jgi:hypothetical protein
VDDELRRGCGSWEEQSCEGHQKTVFSNTDYLDNSIPNRYLDINL